MSTVSTSATSGCWICGQRRAGPLAPPRPHPRSASDLSYGLQVRKDSDSDLAHDLSATVPERFHRDVGDVEKGRECRAKWPRGAVLGLQRDADVSVAGAQETLGATLREPGWSALHEAHVGAVGSAHQLRMRTHRASHTRGKSCE